MASLFEEVESIFDQCTVASLKRQELRLRWEGMVSLYGRSFQPDVSRLMELVIDAQEECKPIVDTILKNWATQLGAHIQEVNGYTPSEQYGIAKTKIFASLLVDHGLYNPDMLKTDSPSIEESTVFTP